MARAAPLMRVTHQVRYHTQRARPDGESVAPPL